MIMRPADRRRAQPGALVRPGLVASEWDDFWVCIFGPLVGGVLAAVSYWYLFVEGPGVRAATPETGPKGPRQDINPPR